MPVDSMTRPFDPAEHLDRSRKRIEEPVKKKMEGEEIVVMSTPEATKVVDLIELLKASVKAAKTRKAG